MVHSDTHGRCVTLLCISLYSEPIIVATVTTTLRIFRELLNDSLTINTNAFQRSHLCHE